MNETVVLVDENDCALGIMDKLEAHQKGLLHRAFSVFIFNSNNELLLQQRALSKYHSAGLWTNTCCSHPHQGDDIVLSAKKRLNEEMGFDTELSIKNNFIYKAEFDNGLTEHEYDYILIGNYSGTPIINKNEVLSYCYKSINEIKNEIVLHPEKYTVWFKLIIKNLF
ncbi:MAG: isopentenyl-diphosphate Delta-isomerase [Bacteroidetes bacterium]|nr:isopentenyl-diphosphate Delta-isomerase [Bacteroidota bacterium]